MSSNIPKFDSRAKNALAVAHQIAIQLGHNYIGSEHLLFGVLSQPQEGLPFQVAFMDNISNQELLEIIRRQGMERFSEFSKNQSEDNQTYWQPEITEELQTCLDSAIRVAEQHYYSYVGLEHLVFGILDTKESHGQSLMNLTETSSQKLKDILNSLFSSYNKEMKSEDIKPSGKQTKQKRNKDSALNFFTTNMNNKVKNEPDFKLVERDREIDRLIQILSRKIKNNPIILGEPGVGKTALIEGLAKRINSGKVPEWLQDKKILSLDVGNLIAGSVFRGEFEQRVKAIIDEVVESKDVILFIDEIHATMGAGASGNSSGPDMVQMLKPALSRGEVSVIGATTEDEYRQMVRKDKAFERRFQSIRIEEPDQKQTINIVRGIKTMYENFHNATYPEPLIEPMVELAGRFVPDRYFPDKAIDILDECLVRARILTAEQTNSGKKKEDSWVELEKQILSMIKEKNEAILNQDYEKSEKIEVKQKELEGQLSELNVHNREAKKLSVVTQDILNRVISEMSGVPMVRISSDIFVQIKDLEKTLNQQIFGQKEAIQEITRALKRSHAGVKHTKGPIAGFLLLGPTGVGKTELVNVLTRELYGDPAKYMLKIDMSEFRERHQMSRLLGAPAGYVGYEDAPQLTDFLKKRPYSVILFDEIEKGHPETLNILLQMLDEGKVTDSKGETVSCENALIFMTSNLGKSQLNKFASTLGFHEIGNEEEQDYQTIRKQVMSEVEKSIKPEILGRLTGRIVFRPLSKTILQQIISKELGLLQSHLLKQGRTLAFEDDVITLIIKKLETKLEYGAREVRSVVAQEISDKLSDFLLDSPHDMGILIRAEQEHIVVTSKTNHLQ